MLCISNRGLVTSCFVSKSYNCLLVYFAFIGALLVFPFDFPHYYEVTAPLGAVLVLCSVGRGKWSPHASVVLAAVHCG